MTTLWLDASAGMAGDMMMGALLDAGAGLADLQAAVDAVIPGSVRLGARTVTRQGLRAVKAEVSTLVDDPPHRTWGSIRVMISDAALAPETARRALAVFEAIARAEGHVHGVDPEQVHFHEVGALDSIADVVACCEGLRLLGVDRVVATPVAVGAGTVSAAHGLMPVPVPAVAQLATGWPTTAGIIPDGHRARPPAGHDDPAGHDHGTAGSAPDDHDSAGLGSAGQGASGEDHAGGRQNHDRDDAHDHGDVQAFAGAGHRHGQLSGNGVSAGGLDGLPGELCTPTGMVLVTVLAERPGQQPAMTSRAVGVGAGTKDLPGRPNVVRVILGDEDASPLGADEVCELAANVDDLDPRVWPEVLQGLLSAGALDAWAEPALMKKGRPAHVLHVLCEPGAAEALGARIMALTGSLGVRRHSAVRQLLARTWRTVTVEGHPLWVKIGHRDGVIVRAQPEFDEVRALADCLGRPVTEVLTAALAAAEAAGLHPGQELTPQQ